MPTTNYTPGQLSGMADCQWPDSPTSAGAEFLEAIAATVADLILVHNEWDDDSAHEVADGCVPIYTYRLWETFVDLGGYNEDPAEIGAENGTLDDQARAALYMIGSRLAHALAEEMGR